jgi:lysophospholipase L1-like esterase
MNSSRLSYGWWLCASVAFIMILLECAAWLWLAIAGRPAYSYLDSQRSGYLYHSYVGFQPAQMPGYQTHPIAGPANLVILGGSTAAGVGPRSFDDAYFTRIREKFGRERKYFQLSNYAVPGYVSSQESAAYLNFIFPAGSPRLVVSITGFNDLHFYIRCGFPVGSHEFESAFAEVFRSGYPEPKGLAERWRNAGRKTNLYSIYHRLTQPPGAPIVLSSDFTMTIREELQTRTFYREQAKLAADNFLRNAEAIALLTKRRGSRYLVVLQPVVFYGGEIRREPNEWYPTAESLEKSVAWEGRPKEHYDEFYSLVLAGLGKMKKEGLLDYLDYRAVLSGSVFLDPVHFDEKGSAQFAEILGEELRRRL